MLGDASILDRIFKTLDGLSLDTSASGGFFVVCYCARGVKVVDVLAIVEVASLAQEVVSACDRVFFPTIVSRTIRLQSRLTAGGVLELQVDCATATSVVEDDSVRRIRHGHEAMYVLPLFCELSRYRWKVSS